MHCCHKGETCDVKKGECVSHGYVTSAWAEKIPAKVINDNEFVLFLQPEDEEKPVNTYDCNDDVDVSRLCPLGLGSNAKSVVWFCMMSM